jgi:esterase/lipase
MFVILDDRYELKHSPKAKLEKYKETAWTLFNNLIDSKHAAVIAAGFFHEAIEEAVLEYIEESLPGEVENEVLKIFKHSKYELMRSVMKDLVKQDVFHYFTMYISEAEIFVQQWLINHTTTLPLDCV